MIEFIHYHDFKHQLSSDLHWLNENKGIWNQHIELEIKMIGSSQLDYYIGGLTVQQIKSEISKVLINKKLDKKENYKHWIEENKGFREISLSDNSIWTLRLIEKESFIHIHPSRYSPHTMRVKANTLKTVLCTLLFEEVQSFIFDINRINHYRSEYLSLSTIKTNAVHNEIETVLNLFINKINNE